MTLCKNCGGVVRPVVAIDIDGTLGDYHKHFHVFCSLYFTGLPKRLSSWNGVGEFEEYIGISKIQYREAKLAYRQGGWKRFMPAYPDASSICQDLRLAGAEVWVATTRPWQRLDNIDPDTQEWLRRNHIVFDGLLYGENKYQQLCEAVDSSRIVAIIEDLPEQVDIASFLGLPVLQRHNHHNEANGQRRWPGGNLAECAGMALERILEWEKG